MDKRDADMLSAKRGVVLRGFWGNGMLTTENMERIKDEV